MKRNLLDGLLEAHENKQTAAVLRWLDQGTERLIIQGIDDDRLESSIKTALDDALNRDRGLTIETAEGKLFIQPFNPALRLIVVGAVHIAQALVPMAALAGYDVVLVDPRRSFANDQRFPDVTINQEWPDDALKELMPDSRTAIVTLTHDPKLDDPALDVALGSDAFYIASLGSRRTHGSRLERLQALGHQAEALARIHGPAGLNLGAVSPAEIAISILAEMTGVLRKTASA